MPPDSTATKKRLLEAAFAEFAKHGLAGARVDRIGIEAAANKRLIYLHFTNKEQLFDTVVTHSIARMSEAVPFTPDDLPGYAGTLFDHLIVHPEHLRLAVWEQLERPVVRPQEQEAYRAKVSAIARTQSLSTKLDPVDILALILGLVTAWLSASPALRQLSKEDAFSPKRLARQRAAVVAAVRAILRSAVTA